jgi:hypothetical protein
MAGAEGGEAGWPAGQVCFPVGREARARLAELSEGGEVDQDLAAKVAAAAAARLAELYPGVVAAVVRDAGAVPAPANFGVVPSPAGTGLPRGTAAPGERRGRPQSALRDRRRRSQVRTLRTWPATTPSGQTTTGEGPQLSPPALDRLREIWEGSRGAAVPSPDTDTAGAPGAAREAGIAGVPSGLELTAADDSARHRATISVGPLKETVREAAEELAGQISVASPRPYGGPAHARLNREVLRKALARRTPGTPQHKRLKAVLDTWSPTPAGAPADWSAEEWPDDATLAPDSAGWSEKEWPIAARAAGGAVRFGGVLPQAAFGPVPRALPGGEYVFAGTGDPVVSGVDRTDGADGAVQVWMMRTDAGEEISREALRNRLTQLQNEHADNGLPYPPEYWRVRQALATWGRTRDRQENAAGNREREHGGESESGHTRPALEGSGAGEAAESGAGAAARAADVLARMGLQLEPVDADGDCLFSALLRSAPGAFPPGTGVREMRGEIAALAQEVLADPLHPWFAGVDATVREGLAGAAADREVNEGRAEPASRGYHRAWQRAYSAARPEEYGPDLVANLRQVGAWAGPHGDIAPYLIALRYRLSIRVVSDADGRVQVLIGASALAQVLGVNREEIRRAILVGAPGHYNATVPVAAPDPGAQANGPHQPQSAPPQQEDPPPYPGPPRPAAGAPPPYWAPPRAAQQWVAPPPVYAARAEQAASERQASSDEFSPRSDQFRDRLRELVGALVTARGQEPMDSGAVASARDAADGFLREVQGGSIDDVLATGLRAAVHYYAREGHLNATDSDPYGPHLKGPQIDLQDWLEKRRTGRLSPGWALEYLTAMGFRPGISGQRPDEESSRDRGSQRAPQGQQGPRESARVLGRDLRQYGVGTPEFERTVTELDRLLVAIQHEDPENHRGDLARASILRAALVFYRQNGHLPIRPHATAVLEGESVPLGRWLRQLRNSTERTWAHEVLDLLDADRQR